LSKHSLFPSVDTLPLLLGNDFIYRRHEVTVTPVCLL